MLGIMIGVGSVVAMISLGEGARASVEESIRSMGTNLLMVRPGVDRRGHVRSATMETLTVADAEALADIPGIAYVAPEVSRSAQVKYLAANMSTAVLGSTPEYLSVRASKVDEGRFFDSADVVGHRRVAVMGPEIVKELFGGVAPLGERIQIKGISFVVIGVFEEKGDAGWSNPDMQIVIPLSTAQRELFGMDNVSLVGVQVEDEGQMTRVTGDIERVLRTRHRIGADGESDFNVRSQTEFLERMNEVTGTFTALLGGVAAVSLLVGGIGVMNIMLVSVRERTREIGIRKAVGARRGDILLQFLIEAVFVSILGGILGIGLGYLLAEIISRFGEWETLVPAYAIILAVTTSAGVGIIFGVWPAREAARLDPVEALRYE